MTDASGNRIAELDTGKYGHPHCKHILLDGRPSRIGGVLHDDEVTRVIMAPGFFVPEAAYGAIMRAVDNEGAAAAQVLVVDPFGTWFEVYDPTGLIDAILSGGGQFLIFDNRAGSYGGANTGGVWTGVNFDGVNTTLTHAGEIFAPYMTGWSVQLDAAAPVYFTVLAATGSSILVAGNVASLVTPDATAFFMIHPVGVNPETGATQTSACEPESRYLWGGFAQRTYLSGASRREGNYLPPIVGFQMTHSGVFGIHGAQPGTNTAGQHYMWNRIYDINTARWTTPDPATTPWWNLWDYVGSGPVQKSDPTGLSVPASLASPENRKRLLEAIRSGEFEDLPESWKVYPPLPYGPGPVIERPVKVDVYGHGIDSLRGFKYCNKGRSKAGDWRQVRGTDTALREGRIADAINGALGEDDCVSVLNIAAHGNTHGAYVSESKPLSGDDLATVNFCQPCKIVLFSCNVGLGDTPHDIADKTGCDVYSPMNFCYPWEPGSTPFFGDEPDTPESVCGDNDSDYIRDSDGSHPNKPGRQDRFRRTRPSR